MNSQSVSPFTFKKSLVALGVASVFASPSVFSQEASNNADLAIVVTATSTPMTAAESLTSTTVIDKAEIEVQQAIDASELLAAQPGVDVSSNGGFGKTTSIYMRGANTESTKFLFDGIPLYSATSGGAPFEYIPTRLIERIEIVRGPKATLYGADAAGGVIQIFSKTPVEGNHADLSIGGGSFGTKQADATVSGASGNTDYLVSLGKIETDGTTVKEGEGDQGYDNQNVLLRLGHKFASGASVRGLVMHTEGNNEYVGNENDYSVQVAGIMGTLPVNEDWGTELQLTHALNKSTTLSTGDKFDTQSQGARWSNIFWSGDHEFVLGAETSEDSVTVSAYDAPDRSNDAGFAQALLDFGQTSVHLNVRQDHNSAYGDSTTGGVALGYQFDDVHTVRASYGTAFEAPTFNDLYYPFSGDENLKATKSKTAELGIRAEYDDLFWDAAIYDASYGDMVIWSNYTGDWFAYNVDSHVQGAELSTGAEFEQWKLAAALTFVDAKDDDTGFQLPKRAKRSMRVSVDRLYEKGQVGATVIGANGRTATLGSSETLGGYAILNLHASYDFAKDWNAKVAVKNAFDKNYQTSKGYFKPGRGVFLTLNYTAF